MFDIKQVLCLNKVAERFFAIKLVQSKYNSLRPLIGVFILNAFNIYFKLIYCKRVRDD